MQALQSLARYWRQQIKAPVVAITGSVGKTSTKVFAQQILSAKYKTYASPGSFNNHWGVPLSILQVGLDVEVVILELGMSAAGEIQALCKLAQPDVVLVTSVAPAHMAYFKSIDEVAQAKAELYEAAPRAQKIFNIDNVHTRKMYNQFAKSGLVSAEHRAKPDGGRVRDAQAAKDANDGGVIVFSQRDAKADVQLSAEQLGLSTLQIQGRIGQMSKTVQASVFGPHHVYNIMGAVGVAMCVGMDEYDVWRAVPRCRLPWGRGQVEQLVMQGGAAVDIVFDAYNANPASMGAFVEALSFDGPAKILVLGEMLELGDGCDEAHEYLGFLLRAVPHLKAVFFLGPSHKFVQQGLLGVQHEYGFKNKNLNADTKDANLKKRGSFTGLLKCYSCYDTRAVQRVVTDVRRCMQTTGNMRPLIAFKASRGVQLERVLSQLKEPT